MWLSKNNFPVIYEEDPALVDNMAEYTQHSSIYLIKDCREWYDFHETDLDLFSKEQEKILLGFQKCELQVFLMWRKYGRKKNPATFAGMRAAGVLMWPRE